MKFHDRIRWVGMAIFMLIQLVVHSNASQLNNEDSLEDSQEMHLALKADMALTAPERREKTFDKYVKKTKMLHVPNMKKSKQEIEEIYGVENQAVLDFEEYERERQKQRNENPKIGGKIFVKKYKRPLDHVIIDVEEFQPAKKKARPSKKGFSLDSSDTESYSPESENGTSDTLGSTSESETISLNAKQKKENNFKRLQKKQPLKRLNIKIFPDSSSESAESADVFDSDDSDDGFVVTNNALDPFIEARLNGEKKVYDGSQKLPFTKNSLKRKRQNQDSDDEAYDDAFPDKATPSKRIARIVPEKQAVVTTSFINAELSPNLEGTFIPYDTETTAHCKCGGRIGEIAGQKVINGVIRQTFHSYCNPDMKSWFVCYEAHKLSEPFLRAQAPFYKIAKHVQEFFGDDIRCGHNGHYFDDEFLNYELTRAWIFFHFKKMLNPNADISSEIPSTIAFDAEKIKAGHKKLKDAGLIKNNPLSAINLSNINQEANKLAAAAMLYYYKDHMTKDLLRNYDKDSEEKWKPGPMMFQNGQIMPDQEEFPKNYEAAANRLKWFRLIRTQENMSLPHTKPVRDAIADAETCLRAIIDMFESDTISEENFRADKIDRSKMFDTYIQAQKDKKAYIRQSTVDNLKLDTLLDHHEIPRYDREIGGHGAGIDTHLLFQYVEKINKIEKKEGTHLHTISKLSQKEQENYFYRKNSICDFDEEGKLVKVTLIHDDKITSQFGDPESWSPEFKAQIAKESAALPAIVSTPPTPYVNPATIRFPPQKPLIQPNRTVPHAQNLANQNRPMLNQPRLIQPTAAQSQRNWPSWVAQPAGQRAQPQPIIHTPPIISTSIISTADGNLEVRVGNWIGTASNVVWKQIDTTELGGK